MYCIVRYLHTPTYVSMQYGWEEVGDIWKKNPEHFLNCHHDAASLPIQMPDASVPSPFSMGILQRSGTEHAHLHVSCCHGLHSCF